MQALFKGIGYLLATIPTLLVLAVAGALGVFLTAFAAVFQFIIMGLALMVGVVYCIWEVFSKPKDTDKQKE